MTEVILNRKKIENLVVKIEDKEYSIPLGGSVPLVTLRKLKTEEGVINFIGSYIPEEVMNTLTGDDFKQILTAWNKATLESQGLPVGES